ncbi:MAG: carbonate dehydratase [Gammaproteobacteria bacterium]|nr:carbonate dehydratase [Gammaproteobacteria bacterium]MDH5728040.1 carbonate dehydratase [Gammaproteobacteria bacterium]
MNTLEALIHNNRQWAKSIEENHPGFFNKLVQQQNPDYLWIGCSDSRVPANEIVGLLPGELFVHRNVANVVVNTDLNCLSVLQYAVEVLQVEHIIVCGHYGCGGVKSALSNQKNGLIDNWLRNIKDVYNQYEVQFKAIKDEQQRIDLLCELNVMEQVANVCHTTIVQDAWDRGQNLDVHGWIYSIQNGLIKDLDVSVNNKDGLPAIYRTAQSHSDN